MNPHRFCEENRPLWQEYEGLLASVESSKADAAEMQRFFPLYRRVCQHLALARQRGYGDGVVLELEAAALRGHQTLYRRRPQWRHLSGQFLRCTFPQEVRSQWRWLLVSLLLFVVPGVAILLWTLADPQVAYSVLSREELAGISTMHHPDNQHRSFEEDLQMFGYYIANNIGISFQVFAGGIFFGIGSIFYLVFNGLFFGVASGHIIRSDLSAPFFSYVVTHSAFEITAIIISGAAGLLLGHALITPGQRTRLNALRHAATSAIVLAGGAACMLVVAALLEAFWSGSEGISYSVKFAVGGMMWLLVGGYLTLAGKPKRP